MNMPQHDGQNAAPEPAAWTLAWDRREGAYAVGVPLADGGRLDLLVQHGSWTVAGAEYVAPSGERVYELRMGGFERFEGAGIETTAPTRLRFLMASEDLDVSLDIESITLNPELPDTLFRLPEIPGAVEHALGGECR